MKSRISADLAATITEWDWLLVQLRIKAIEISSPETTFMLENESKDSLTLEWVIISPLFDTLRDDNSPQEEQIEILENWKLILEDASRDAFCSVPRLQTQFAERGNISIVFSRPAGMSRYDFCQYNGEEFVWTA